MNSNKEEDKEEDKIDVLTKKEKEPEACNSKVVEKTTEKKPDIYIEEKKTKPEKNKPVASIIKNNCADKPEKNKNHPQKKTV